MALYKLSFAVFSIQDIYARSQEDIARWLHFYNQNPVEVVTKSGAEPGGLTDIIEVKKGELTFDFGGSVSGREYAYVDFLPDFTAKIRLESLPHFPSYLTRIEEYKEADLYAVQTSPNGAIAPVCYVPQDVFQAFKKCDVTAHELRAEKHIERLNQALVEKTSFRIRPKVTRKKDFN